QQLKPYSFSHRISDFGITEFGIDVRAMPRRTRRKTRFSQPYLRFLKLLREARIKAGLTQTQAARRIRQPQSFVAKCESGERRVDIVELIVFCRTYRINAAKFVRRLGRQK